jgi:hypothetical protein
MLQRLLVSCNGAFVEHVEPEAESDVCEMLEDRGAVVTVVRNASSQDKPTLDDSEFARLLVSKLSRAAAVAILNEVFRIFGEVREY